MNKLAYITISLLIFILGIAIGCSIDNIPYLSLKKDIGLIEVINLFILIIISIVVPLSIQKFTTNSRSQKDFLINEIKSYADSIEDLQEYLTERLCCSINKQKVLFFISRSDNHLAALRSQLELAYNQKLKPMYQETLNSHINYRDKISDGNLMADDFKIDMKFFNGVNSSYTQLNIRIKELIHFINAI